MGVSPPWPPQHSPQPQTLLLCPVSVLSLGPQRTLLLAPASKTPLSGSGWKLRQGSQTWQQRPCVRITKLLPSSVPSWISKLSFLRWCFSGLMQIQFNGYPYTVQIGNITFTVPGDEVSSEGWEFSLQGLLRAQHPWELAHQASVSAVGGSHGPELAPTLRHLPHCHWHQLWLPVPLLSVLEVHQTEVNSRLVMLIQACSCWWDPSPRAGCLPWSPLDATEDKDHRAQQQPPLGAAVAQVSHRMAVE